MMLSLYLLLFLLCFKLLKKEPFLGILDIAPTIFPLIMKTLLSPLLILGKYFWHIIKLCFLIKLLINFELNLCNK